MVICLERVADLHLAQLTPLQLTASCFSKIQIGFTFLVPAYPGSPRKRVVKCVCVCVKVAFEQISALLLTDFIQQIKSGCIISSIFHPHHDEENHSTKKLPKFSTVEANHKSSTY